MVCNHILSNYKIWKHQVHKRRYFWCYLQSKRSCTWLCNGCKEDQIKFQWWKKFIFRNKGNLHFEGVMVFKHRTVCINCIYILLLFVLSHFSNISSLIDTKYMRRKSFLVLENVRYDLYATMNYKKKTYNTSALEMKHIKVSFFYQLLVRLVLINTSVLALSALQKCKISAHSPNHPPRNNSTKYYSRRVGKSETWWFWAQSDFQRSYVLLLSWDRYTVCTPIIPTMMNWISTMMLSWISFLVLSMRTGA
jgi:hypothetical protein